MFWGYRIIGMHKYTCDFTDFMCDFIQDTCEFSDLRAGLEHLRAIFGKCVRITKNLLFNSIMLLPYHDKWVALAYNDEP